MRSGGGDTSRGGCSRAPWRPLRAPARGSAGAERGRWGSEGLRGQRGFCPPSVQCGLSLFALAACPHERPCMSCSTALTAAGEADHPTRRYCAQGHEPQQRAMPRCLGGVTTSPTSPADKARTQTRSWGGRTGWPLPGHGDKLWLMGHKVFLLVPLSSPALSELPAQMGPLGIKDILTV